MRKLTEYRIQSGWDAEWSREGNEQEVRGTEQGNVS